MAEVTLLTLEQLEAKVRSGDYASVREFLRNVSRSDIPDRLTLNLCQLARRIDYAKKGIVLLRERIIDLPPQIKPDPREQAEYAACLLKLGGVSEARRLLSEVPAEKAPEVYKYLAFTYVHQWDYAAAIPLLKSYLARPELTDYDRLVGSLNLGAALVAVEDYSQAVEILTPLRTQAENEGHKLVLGNTCELLAQTQIHLGKFAKAAEFIEWSWQSLKTAQPRYRMYLEKWKAVAALMQNPKDEVAQTSLRQVRSEAIERADWETIRDCDLHESVICGDQAMFLHLYFGTPYLPYRQTMLRRSGGSIAIPASYRWGRAPRELNLDSGRMLDSRALKKGLARHRLLKALAFDFYAPATVAQVFVQIFEQERFHPETSAPRIHELVRRLRSELAAANIELPIQSQKRGYKIDIENANCALTVNPNRSPSEGILTSIKSLYGTNEFQLRDLSEQTHTAHTTLYRELKRLVADGQVNAIGKGKQTRYKAA